MQLSKDFSLSELTVTETGLTNLPDPEAMSRLFYLATFILQPIRNTWGRISVNSAFRTPEVNNLIGGVHSSQHLRGEAADIMPESAFIEDVFYWIQQNMQYGQVILEDRNEVRWIHVSLPRFYAPNQQALLFDGSEYRQA